MATQSEHGTSASGARDQRTLPPPLPPVVMSTSSSNPAFNRSNSLNSTSLGKAQLSIKTHESVSSVQSERSRHVHIRKVTRDIAALDFLQNIPMRSEQQQMQQEELRLQAIAGKGKMKASQSAAPPAQPLLPSKAIATDETMQQVPQEPLAGRRLPGFEATTVNIPPLFRYRSTTKYPAESAVVRRWEAMTAQQGLLQARTFLSSGHGYPLAVFSVIKYSGHGARASVVKKRIPPVVANQADTSDYDWRGKSYFRLLHATWAPCDPDRDSQDDHPTVTPYLPNYLDDPEFRQGRHRHVVRGNKNIGPVVSSILLFVKPHELKEELNTKFREKHTWLTADLSLSKIRNLKRETLASCQRLALEVATAALACVYFEKLILSQYVTKANRKLYMSVCFLLAAKFNEPKSSDMMKSMVKKILIEIDQIHSLPSREVLTAEFQVYAQLSFALHVPLAEVQPHFTRLLKFIESNPRKYLDEDIFTTYSALILEEKAAMHRVESPPSFSGGDTHDEGTDIEAIVSDEDPEDGNEATTSSDRSMFLWNQMSFSKWWKERRFGASPLSRSQKPQTQLQDKELSTQTSRSPSPERGRKYEASEVGASIRSSSRGSPSPSRSPDRGAQASS